MYILLSIILLIVVCSNFFKSENKYRNKIINIFTLLYILGWFIVIIHGVGSLVVYDNIYIHDSDLCICKSSSGHLESDNINTCVKIKRESLLIYL